VCLCKSLSAVDTQGTFKRQRVGRQKRGGNETRDSQSTDRGGSWANPSGEETSSFPCACGSLPLLRGGVGATYTRPVKPRDCEPHNRHTTYDTAMEVRGHRLEIPWQEAGRTAFARIRTPVDYSRNQPHVSFLRWREPSRTNVASRGGGWTDSCDG
jgi:hypothetical protein